MGKSVDVMTRGELEDEVEELRERLTEMVPSHSGACCTFDADGKVVVTKESCRCGTVVMHARLALAEWG